MPQRDAATPAAGLNVIVIEDRRSDAELMLYELREAGYEPHATCVTAEGDFVRALQPDIDVILADYSLPGFDAPRALARLQESGLDIPLVIVSGTVGEETALAAMRLGAADYILKDRLRRLGPAVAEAIKKRRLVREKQAAHRLIADREKRFRALIECSTDGILMLAPDSRIQYASPAAARILHQPAGALAGQSALSFVSGKAAAAVGRGFRKFVERGDRIIRGEFRCRRADGSDCWLEATAGNLLNVSAVGAVVVNFRDVTARVDSERQLTARARELALKNEHLARTTRRLEDLNAAAHQIIANVSHDFRTPLTVLREYCSLLREGLGGPLTAQQQEFTDVMNSRIDDLALMVENMLDTSAHEAGIMLMFRRVATLSEICDQVPCLIERRAHSKGISLEFKLDETPAVFCDPEKVQRVIVNLAVNAVKFTPPGGKITLWCRDEPEAREVTFGISDTGSGISESDLKVIFDRFRQLDNAAESKGFGLGLNITREFVRLNLGTMNVASRVGQGSTFSFTLPWAEPRLVFGRFLDLLRSLPEPPQHVTLLEVGIEGDAVRCRKSDLVHLLRLRLHSDKLAYPAGELEWRLVIPCGEGEAGEYVHGLET